MNVIFYRSFLLTFYPNTKYNEINEAPTAVTITTTTNKALLWTTILYEDKLLVKTYLQTFRSINWKIDFLVESKQYEKKN